MAPFDRSRTERFHLSGSHTSAYSPSIVTKAISCIVCEIYIYIYSNLLVENFEIFIPHLYLALPKGGGSRRNFVKMFDAGKTRMIGLRYGEKSYDDMLSRFHLIPERNRRTDRQTDLLYQQ